MAASDYVPIFFKNRLHLAGRPQMSTPVTWAACRASASREGCVPVTAQRRFQRGALTQAQNKRGVRGQRSPHPSNPAVVRLRGYPAHRNRT
jgi:hypothetical protein